MSNSFKKNYECAFLPSIDTSTCSSLSCTCSTYSMLSVSTCSAVELWRIRINVHHLQLSIENSSILINSLLGIKA